MSSHVTLFTLLGVKTNALHPFFSCFFDTTHPTFIIMTGLLLPLLLPPFLGLHNTTYSLCVSVGIRGEE